MRTRFRSCLLCGLMLSTGTAISGIIWWNEAPPLMAVHIRDRVRIGMNRSEVEHLLPYIPTSGEVIAPTFGRPIYGVYVMGDGWWLQVDYDDRGRVVTGKSLVHWDPEGPGYRSAWCLLQKWIPALPDLPFQPNIPW
jgi:hypothetical protein